MHHQLLEARSVPLKLLKPTRSALVVLALGSISVLGMPLLLAQTGFLASTGYTVQRLEESKAYWANENHKLEVEVAALRSLDRIEQEARSRLKMISPPSYLYVVVDTLPRDPTPLLKRGLPKDAALSQPKGQPWWEALLFSLFYLGSRP